MVQIPPHYTELFITERYKKALYIVQNLPKGSTFQPTNNQKLELYSLYKQVSEGDINIKRPGLFDVVGRAKWDSWKKLEGISILEAMHTYVEALLRITTEAYKKNIGKEQAQDIIHSFAIMRPSVNDDLDTDDISNQEEDDSSAASDEEQEYLRDILKSNGNKVIPLKLPETDTPYGSPDRQTLQSRRASSVSSRTNKRPSSIASVQTMVTAPSTRPPSAAGSVGSVKSRLGQNKYRGNEKYLEQHMIKNDLDVLPNKALFNEEFDDNVNPWQHIPMTANIINIYRSNNENTSRPTTENLRKIPPPPQQRPFQQNNNRPQRPASYLKSPSTSSIPQHLYSATPVSRGQLDQFPVTNTLSFATATPQLNNMHIYNNSQNVEDAHVYATISNNSASHIQSQSRYVLPNSQKYNASIVTLGPATKRALEVLHNEVIALNDRIDDLKRELVERDKEGAIKKSDVESKDESYDRWDWVTKVVVKYAGFNPMTALILIFVLYQSGNLSGRFWQKIKLFISK